MQSLVKAGMNYIYPQDKTLSERCGDYVKKNPGTVAKGAAASVVAWYTVPIVIAGVGWLPYIGAVYYIYNNTRIVQDTYSWYKWGMSWFVKEE